VLEHENSAAFWDNIYALSEGPGEERGRTAHERLSAILAFGVVEIQMQGIVRSLCSVRRFVGAVAMRCAVSNGRDPETCTYA
jgi:hypothetical protein